MCTYINICKAEEGLFNAEFVKIIPLFPLFSFLAKRLQASQSETLSLVRSNVVQIKYVKYQCRHYNYTESHIRQSLSLSNFFNSENIGLKHSLSLSNFSTVTMNALIRYWNIFLDCANVELSCSIAGWKKNNICSGLKDFNRPTVFILRQRGIP
jgi:hypothetical protein